MKCLGARLADLLRALILDFRKIHRTRPALEKAWCLSSAPLASATGQMDDPLSDWNQRVAAGKIPALVMNATVAETGERLLLATTQITASKIANRARVDATELHTINGEEFDVGIVTAARLSASFPYVTPAARVKSKPSSQQPHIVDGGYYDNYGMATLVEWLDEALDKTSRKVKSVLVPGARVAGRRRSSASGGMPRAAAGFTKPLLP